MIRTPLLIDSPVGRSRTNKIPDVFRVKYALHNLGHLDRPATGMHAVVADPFIDAIASFQRENGLRPDGYINPGGPTEEAINQRLAGIAPAAGLGRDESPRSPALSLVPSPIGPLPGLSPNSDPEPLHTAVFTPEQDPLAALGATNALQEGLFSERPSPIRVSQTRQPAPVPAPMPFPFPPLPVPQPDQETVDKAALELQRLSRKVYGNVDRETLARTLLFANPLGGLLAPLLEFGTEQDPRFDVPEGLSIPQPGFPGFPPLKERELNTLKGRPADPNEPFYEGFIPPTGVSGPYIEIFPDQHDDFDQLTILESRRGDPKTRRQLHQLVVEGDSVIEELGTATVHVGGGSTAEGQDRKERYFPNALTGGRKESSYPDLAYRSNISDRWLIINTVDTIGDGRPDSRERRAMVRMVLNVPGGSILVDIEKISDDRTINNKALRRFLAMLFKELDRPAPEIDPRSTTAPLELWRRFRYPAPDDD